MTYNFDSRLGLHGGTRYRYANGRLAPNLNKDKPWYCKKSPVGAHFWIIKEYEGKCKYCSETRNMDCGTPYQYQHKKSPFGFNKKPIRKSYGEG